MKYIFHRPSTRKEQLRTKFITSIKVQKKAQIATMFYNGEIMIMVISTLPINA